MPSTAISYESNSISLIPYYVALALSLLACCSGYYIQYKADDTDRYKAKLVDMDLLKSGQKIKKDPKKRPVKAVMTKNQEKSDKMRGYLDLLVGNANGVYSSAPFTTRVLTEMINSNIYLRLLFRSYKLQWATRLMLALEAYTRLAIAITLICIFYDYQHGGIVYDTCGVYYSEDSCTAHSEYLYGHLVNCQWISSIGKCKPLFPSFNGRIVLLIVFFSGALASLLNYIIHEVFMILLCGYNKFNIYKSGSDSDSYPLFLNFSEKYEYLHRINKSRMGTDFFVKGTERIHLTVDNIIVIEETFEDFINEYSREYRNLKKFKMLRDNWHLDHLHSNLFASLQTAFQIQHIVESRQIDHTNFYLFVRFIADLINNSGENIEMSSAIYLQKLCHDLMMCEHGWRDGFVDKYYLRVMLGLFVVGFNGSLCYIR